MPQTINGGNIQFGVGFKTDSSGLKGIVQSFQQLKKIKPVDFNGSKKELKQFQTMLSDLQGMLTRSFNVDLGSINITKFNAELQKSKYSLQDIYNRFSQSGVQGQVAFNNLANNVANSNLKLKETKSLVDSLGQTFMNSIKWNIASSVINAFTGSIQQAFGYVKNLDSSLTNIRIVTGDSRDQMAKFAVEANNAAAALGKTTRDYTNAALSFYQQGLNDEEVRVRTEASLKAQNITQGQASVDELTAVWNGYQVSVAETQKYVDKLAAVADSSASDMSQLATAMSKVASTANVMGVDIDQLTAQIATIVATTRQAPQTVGNALKTIYARINDIKAGTDDAETSLGNYTGKMASLGFSVLDANGQLRDTGQVMEEIGERWETLTKEQQVYLAQTMAGQRQYNQLISLFDNWTQYSEMLNVSLESEGTLNEKNSRYMESLAAHMEQFTTARQNLMDSILNSDDMKGFVDFGTNAINLVARLVDTLGGSKTTLIAMAGILTNLFSKTLGTQINKVIVNFQNLKQNQEKIAERAEFITNIGKMEGITNNPSLDNMVKKWQELNKYAKSMTAEQQNQAAAMIANAQKAEDELNIYKDQKKEAKEIANLWASQTKNRKDLTHLSETDPAYKQLSKNADFISTKTKELLAIGQKVQKNSFKIISEKDIERAKQLKSQIDKIAGGGKKQNSSIKTQSSALDTTIRKLQNFNAQIKKNDNEIEKHEQRIQELNSKKMSDVEGINTARQNEIKTLQKEIEKLKAANEELKKSKQEASGEFGRQINLYSQDALSQSDLMKKMLTDMGLEFDQIEAKAKAAGKTVDEFLSGKRQQWEAQGVAKFTGALTQTITAAFSLKNTLSVLGDESKSAGEKIESVVTGLAFSLPMLINGLKSLRASFPQVISAINSFAVANTALEASALQGASKVKILGASLKALLLQFWPIILAIGAVSAAIYLSIKAWNKQADAAKKATQSAKEAKQQYNSVKQAFDQLKSEIEDYKSSHQAIEKMTQGTQEWKQAIYEANLQVTELLTKYPKLAEYIEKNSRTGLLSINEEGFDKLLKEQQKQLDFAQQTFLVASNKSLEANVRASAREIGHESTYINSSAPSAATRVGFSQVSVDKIIKLAEEYNKDQSLLAKDFQDISEQTGLSVQEVTTVLNAEKEQVKNLAAQIKTNTEAIRANNNIIADNYLSENNAAYQGIQDEGLKNTVADLFANATQAAQQTELEKWELKNDKTIQQEYANRMGYAYSENKTGGVGIYYNAQGQEVAKLKDDAVRAALALQDAQEGLNGKTADYIALAEKLNNILGETGSSFVGGKGGSLVGLSLQELEKLEQKDLSTLFSEEEIKALGYDSGQEYVEALQQAISNAKINYHNIRMGLTYGLRHSFDDITKDKGLSVEVSQSVANLLEQAFAHGGTDFSTPLGLIFKDLDKTDTEALTNLLSGIDWTQDGAVQQLTDGIHDLGINVDTTSDEFIALTHRLSDVAHQSLSAFDALDKVRSALKEISSIQDLQLGEVVSDQDYEKLLAINPLIKDFFMLTAEGYQLVGDKDSLVELMYGSGGQLDAAISRFKELQQLALTVSNTPLPELSGQEKLTGQDLSQIQAYSNSSVGQKALQAIAGVDRDSLDAALTTLKDLRNKDYEDMDAATKTKYDNAKSIVQDYYKSIQQMQNDYAAGLYDDSQLSQLIATSSNTLSELKTQLLNEAVNSDDYAKAIQNTGKKESQSLGLDPEVVARLADKFQKEADNLEQVDNQLDEHRDIALEVAQSYKRLQRGLQAFVKDQEKLVEALSDSDNIGDYTEALAQMGDIMADVLDMDDTSLLSADFLASEDTINRLNEIIDGGENAEQALLDLRTAAANDIAVNIKSRLETEQLQTQFIDLNNQILDFVNTHDIEMGATIDDTQFIATCQQMANMANMTAEEIQAYYNALGYKANVRTKTETSTTHHVIHHQQTYFNTDGSTQKVNYVDSFDDVATVQVPQIQSITYTGPKGGTVRAAGSGARAARPTPKSGGGRGGKGGGGGKGSQPKQPKEEKPKQVDLDPYHKINRQLDDQQRKLKKLDDLEERLIPRDRLAVLEKESKEYVNQIKLLKEKEGIANSELARLKTALTGQNASNVKVQFQANGQIANYNEVLKGAYDKYNQWVINVYNKMTAEQQQAAASQKQARENALKQLEQNLQEYEKTLDLIDDIKDALQAANQAQAALFLTALKYRMQVREAAGDLQRQFQDFSDKVIKDLADDDYLAQVQSKFNKIMSYVNSKELEERKTQIDILKQELDNINKGIASKYSAAEVQSMLDDLLKQQMNDLQEIKDLQKEIQQQFIDALDNAKDKQDQVMDQYGRINDQIQRGIDLTTKLYGDKAYAMLDKYYEKQNANNLRELQTLKQQENYWRAIMSSQQTGSQAWKAARENLEAVIDAFGDKLEQALDNLATWWENQVDLLVNNLNNTLTNGLGADYLDMQWDQMSKFDDDFLDAVNRNFATNEIRDMYQEGLDSLADSPAAQARLNDLMNDQLKILEEKENLTQYDIDRAKALYDIEMKRFELEELRNSKTTMRLRRDSQGNYTYQYVEDEEKVSDLQKSLAEAENNLYNLDKEHYKETLENMYDVYKEYIDERRKLEEEYAQARQQLEDAQTEQEKAAAQARMEQLGAYENTLNEWYQTRAKAYGEDILYNKIYVGDSAAASSGLTDLSPADKEELVNSLVPYASSAVAALAKNISEEGGFFEAVIKPLTAELTNATTQLLAGTDVAKDIYDENAELRDTQTEALLQLDIIEMNKAAQQVSNVSNTLKSIDEWLKENFTQEYFDNIANGVNTMQQSNVLKGENAEQMGLGGDETIKAAPMETSTQVGAVPFSINGSAVSVDDAARLEYWQGLLNTANGNDAYATALANYEGALQTAAINRLVNSLAEYYNDPSKYLSQAVTINAEFPNVETWQEIIDAIQGLTLTASQTSSSTIRTAG